MEELLSEVGSVELIEAAQNGETSCNRKVKLCYALWQHQGKIEKIANVHITSLDDGNYDKH